MIVPGTGVLLGAATPEAGSVSPVIIANPNNGEFTFAGAGGGAPTAAQATGAVARATVEERPEPRRRAGGPPRAGRLGQRHRLSVGPAQQRRHLSSGHRSGRRRARAARRRALGAADVGQALAPRRRGRSVHRHGRDGGCRREGGGGRHRHPSRGRPAQHAGAQGARSPPRTPPSTPTASAMSRRSACRRCASASRATIATPIESRSRPSA